MSATEVFTKGARIWISDPTKVWRAAELLENYTGQKSLQILYEDGENEWKEGSIPVENSDQLPHLRNPDILVGENDLTSLSYLNEPEVLYNLSIRFERNIIYTYCGIVLVAINPYEQLPIYGTEVIQAYSGQDMQSIEPHVFAVAEEAFKQLTTYEVNQSIIVSGESGAGKTVSAKYTMRYFAMVGGSQEETQVEQKVLASNPIMEAFGNAKTIRNDNSSRFGKYLEIHFNNTYHIIGAHMKTYLLEKSRLVFQATDERNYHIFYQLCASAKLPEFKDLCLGMAKNFFYTNQGDDAEITGVDDAEEMSATRDALSTLGINESTQFVIFKILSAILHFGNVIIHEGDGETSTIHKSDRHLLAMSHLLGIDMQQLRVWMCYRKIETVGETLTKPLNLEQALFCRDALSKRIYIKLFNYLVSQINQSLRSTQAHKNFIGVLDIYGFETFEINSFEQFCINYANEKLQQQFNLHVFKLEQDEYVREEIEWSFINFYDNQPCIDLIEKRLGILDLLDEECKMPQGSDVSWCQKLYKNHLKTSEHFEKPRMSNVSFIVCHFAERVTYNANGFLEKNRDTIFDEHINILKASEIDLVAELFADEKNQRRKSRGASFTIKPMTEPPRTTKKEHKQTVGYQFKDSLGQLMDILNSTTPHYIRCIKPNDHKLPFNFEPSRAVEQLRACGVLETIRISAAGYPSRWSYSDFYQRYRVLMTGQTIHNKQLKESCRTILNKVIKDEDKYRFGKTKIFFRAGQVAYMEKVRFERLCACSILIQKHARRWVAQRKYMRLRKTILFLQTHGRGLLARRYARFLRETKSATRIQSCFRYFRIRRKFLETRKSTIYLQSAFRRALAQRRYVTIRRNTKCVTMQSYIRMWLWKRKYKRARKGLIKLQGYVRIFLAKKELKRLKIQARSVEHQKNINKGLENKIIELQQKLDKEKHQLIEQREQNVHMTVLKQEVENLRVKATEGEKSSERLMTLEEQVQLLKTQLYNEINNKEMAIKEKDDLEEYYKEIVRGLNEEIEGLRCEVSDLDQLNKTNELSYSELMKQQDTYKELLGSYDEERSQWQRIVNENSRLEQRCENLQTQMSLNLDQHGLMRTPSDVSLESNNNNDDLLYGIITEQKRPKRPARRTESQNSQNLTNSDVPILLKQQ